MFRFSFSETLSLTAILIQPATVYITYLLGRRESKLEKRYEALRERYDTFYSEYIKLLAKRYLIFIDMLDKLEFYDFSEFQELIEQDIYLVDSQTLSYYPAFVRINLDLLEYNEKTPGFEKSPEYFKAIFILISSSVILQAIEVSSELKLPNITEFFYNLYCQKNLVEKSQHMYKLYLENLQSRIHR